MAALGTYLSNLREERGVSIEEMARVTRVASRYLEALEREDFTALPASVFTKGYIRAYCQALGVPVDEALARYSGTSDVSVATPPPPSTAPAATRNADQVRRSRGTLLVSFVLLVGFGLALFVVALFLQSGRPEVGARRAEAPAPRVESKVVPGTVAAPEAPPAPAEAIPPPAAASSPPVPTPTPTAAPSAVSAPAATKAAAPAVTPPRAAETKPAAPAEPRPAPEPVRATPTAADPPPLRLGSMISPYRLVARAVESTWLRVRTEDGRATEETIPPGEVREWISNRPFVVTIGNAAGVTLELNGQKLPSLGGPGVVINRLVLPPPEP